MSRQTRRFVPRLEAFGERTLPSVTISEFSDGTLQILGDAAANHITIQDTGKDEAGSVTVEADGQLYVSRGVVTRIKVLTYGGADTVDYWLVSDLTTNHTVSVDLGMRNDTFTAHLDGQNLAAGASLNIQAFGRGGADRLDLEARGVTIGAGSHLAVDLQGGHGKDAVVMNCNPAFCDPTGLITLATDEKRR
jgi:hypothetical protein